MGSTFGKFLVVSILYLCSHNCILAQKTDYKFNQITVKDGLSSNRIWDILRDSRDFLWVCTDVGLNRYDSKNVVKYLRDDDDPGTISSNTIRYTYEDQQGNLWFGSDSGLNLYHPETESFTVFSNDPNDSTSLAGSYVNGMMEDQNGNLWVLTNGIYLNKWNAAHQNFKRFPFESGGQNIYAPPLNMMALDSHGNIWISSFKRGLIKFNPKTAKFAKFDDPAIDFGYPCYKSVFIDRSDKIWIGSDGNGFFSFDTKTGKFKKYPSRSDGYGVNQNIILDIIGENDRYLLLAVDQGGINRFDKFTETFEYLMYHEDDNTYGLNNNGIWCFFKDKEGILWVGTSGGGINYYNPKESRFNLYRSSKNVKNSLSYNFTGCFYEDHQGNIWVGTDGGGINILDPDTKNFKILKHDPANPNSISGNVIRCMAEDKNTDVWVGTWDAGLNQYNRKTGRFRRYMPHKNDPASISGRSVWHMLIDHRGLLWLSIYNVGIDVFHPDKGVIKRFRVDPADTSSLLSNDVTFIYEDDKKNIWLTTEAGLNLYDPESESFKVFKHFPDNKLNAFFKDSNGNYWVGTSQNGLIQMDVNGNIGNIYDKKRGLSDNNVKAITEDNSGFLWISTNDGLNRFDPENEVFKTYYESDGLQGNQFFQQSFMKSKSGELYFGGYDGFNSFDPDNLVVNDFIPPVYLTDFKLFNESVAIGNGSPLKTSITTSDVLRLTWENSVISFDFVGINYTHPEKNQYMYMLEGFETKWNTTDASRSYTTYTNLDPGDYVFRVKASNNDGVWNETSASLKLIITPPFWRTVWFKIFMIFGVVILISLIFFIRTNQLRKTNVMLEKKVSERTKQLKDLVYELKENKDELETTNEELMSIMEELSEQKKYVDNMNAQLEKTHEELRQINEQLDLRVQERTARLLKVNRELDRLVYSASHDLGAPLKSLSGLIHLTKRENINEEVKANLSHMELSVKRLENVILRLTQLSKNLETKVRKEKIPFDKLIDEILEDMEPLIGCNKEMIVRNYQKNDFIKTDPMRIKIILNNLIANAFKYNKNHSKIEIRFLEKENRYEIEVRDEGIGIAKDNLKNIFQMFYRGTEKSDGTGLGLYITNEFIDKMKGSITVDSIEGEYTSFKIILPK